MRAGTYAYAVQTGAPHICQTEAPSFFGERMQLEAYVEGDDFEASDGEIVHFARLNGIGFGWYDHGVSPLIGGDVPLVTEIRLHDYDQAYEQLMHHPPPRWDNFFIFIEPASHDSCAPTSRRPIALPEREHRDLTELLLSQQKEYFDQAVDALEKLPFTLLIPDASLANRFGYTDGHASRSGYGIRFANWAVEDSSELTIGLVARSSDAPASRCMDAMPHEKCALLVTTRKGYEIYRDFEENGLPHYYVEMGGALVHLSFPHYKRGPKSDLEFWAHPFAPGEIEAIFDSLQEARPEDVVRLPGMTFDSEAD